MAEQVDQEALEDSNKALSVIMILAILASTGYFFYLNLDRNWHFFYNTRRYMIIVLTAGDIFFALFSIFVYTRVIYEKKNYSPGCPTTACAIAYAFSYFPFVYATGIVCLCVELAFRHRIRAFFTKVEQHSLFMAGLPWLIGLLITLPLSFAEMNWDMCKYDNIVNIQSRMRAIIWISVVLPSTVAVLCCFILKHVKVDVVPKGRYPGGGQNPPQGGPVSAATAAPSDLPAAPLPPPHAGQIDAEPCVYTYGNAPSQPSVPGPQPSSTYTSLESAQPPGITSSGLGAMVEKQKVQNLVIASIFFVMVMPYAIFWLATKLNESAEPLDPVPDTVLDRLFFWLFLARSAVLPVVWARFPATTTGAMYVSRD